MSISIAAALRQSKGLKGSISTLSTRLHGVVSWEEGDEPPFVFDTVLAEYSAAVEELTKLRAAVARANATANVVFRGRRMTLAEAVLRFGELKARASLFSGLTIRKGKVRSRSGYDDVGRSVSETVVYHSALTEPARVVTLGELQNELDELDGLLQETNHRTVVKLQEVGP